MTYNLRQMAEDEVIFRFENDDDRREFWELFIKNSGDRYNNHISNFAKLWECEDGKLYIDNYKYNLTHEYYPTWTEIKERYEMKVKIVKCSDKDYWYKGRIGEVFEIIKELEFNFMVVDMGIFRNILKADTVPVSEIRYELKSTVIYDTCVTPCEHKKNTKVGSVGCSECEYNCGNDKEAQTVQCSWQVGDTVVVEGFKGMKKSYVKEESKEMKRLDIRKDYEDENIGIKPYNELKYYWIEIKNNGHDIMAIKLGAYGVSLNQANAILKVMGLDYELYEATDWSKVEEGAEVVFWLTCGNLKGQVRGKFNSYIPNLKKVIVIVDDEVNVVDEDEVELC